MFARCGGLVVFGMVLAYVDDGLDDGDDAVDNGHEAAGDGVHHGVELECVSGVVSLIVWREDIIRKMRRRPLLRCLS